MKHTTWVNDEWAVVEILEGPAAGKYHVSIWNDEDGKVRLGTIVVDGKERALKTMIEDIEGYAEHKMEAIRKLDGEMEAGRKCQRCGKHVERTVGSR